MFKFDDTLMLFVKKDLNKGIIPMLLGEPGIGKSSWLTALADLMHTKCFTLACNQLADKADLTGARLVPVTDKNGNTVSYKQVFYPHAVIHDCIEYALANPRETPILFMDELNRTTPDVTSEALSIPTMRAIGSVKLPDNVRVVIAGNDKGNVTSLDEASISRFSLYHVVPDTQTFLNLDPNLNVFVRKVLTAHPECIFGKTVQVVAATAKNNGNDDDDDQVSIDEILDDGDEMAQIATPRTISAVSNWLNDFSNQELLSAISTTHVEDGVEVSALREGITTTNNQVNAINVGKPQCYDAMKACSDMTALNTFVQGMTDNERSGAMLYLLYERADNTVFIQALAPTLLQLQPQDARQMTQLAAADQLDQGNVDALLATNAPIAQALAGILQMF